MIPSRSHYPHVPRQKNYKISILIRQDFSARVEAIRGIAQYAMETANPAFQLFCPSPINWPDISLTVMQGTDFKSSGKILITATQIPQTNPIYAPH